jgi:hypothetical protein
LLKPQWMNGLSERLLVSHYVNNSHALGSKDAAVGETFARWTAIRKLPHRLLDAVREGLAAHREYERLMSKGVRHDCAIRAAFSEASHSPEASTRKTSIQSVKPPAFAIADIGMKGFR